MRAPRYSTFKISTRCWSPIGKLPTSAPGSTVKPYSAAESVQRLPGGGQRWAHPRAALDAEHDVLRHGQGVDQHEVLMHHADPAGDRIARTAQADGTAVEQDLAAVGLVQAVEDAHQGRFSGGRSHR